MTSPYRGYKRLTLVGSPLAFIRRIVVGAQSLLHNGTSVLDYPESEWDMVAFPAQKGGPYVADNLATVNDHSFLGEPRFEVAHQAAASRWARGQRDVRWRLHTFLWAIETALRTNPVGALIEIGTGNGFMAAGACESFDWGSDGVTESREFWLFDSFEAIRRDELPTGGPRHFFYAEGDVEVRAHFSRWPDIHIVTGWLPETMASRPPGPVCFVHVDLNHAESEIRTLEILQADLVPGAIILFDDSGNPGCEEQLEAHRRWAGSLSAPFLQLPTGQGLCIVPAAGRGTLER